MVARSSVQCQGQPSGHATLPCAAGTGVRRLTWVLLLGIHIGVLLHGAPAGRSQIVSLDAVMSGAAEAFRTALSTNTQTEWHPNPVCRVLNRATHWPLVQSRVSHQSCCEYAVCTQWGVHCSLSKVLHSIR